MTDQPSAGRIDGATHILPVRIYYEDTDASGIVYHANYLRYMERGRSDFLRLLGIHHIQMLDAEDPVAWTIRHMEIDFIKPARIDDALEIHTNYTKLTGARLLASQVVRRDGEDLIRAQLQAACISRQGRATRIPSWARDKLSSILTSA